MADAVKSVNSFIYILDLILLAKCFGFKRKKMV